MPQGVAALLAFDYDADFETNHRLMSQAIGTVKTIEITRAVRSTTINGMHIKRKQTIAILDGGIVAACDEPDPCLLEALAKAGAGAAEVITLYYGSDVEEADAQAVASLINQEYPQLQMEVIKGGQQHYSYILSVE
jgi:dihydroxyacetone kinase-like predicted kinase